MTLLPTRLGRRKHTNDLLNRTMTDKQPVDCTLSVKTKVFSAACAETADDPPRKLGAPLVRALRPPKLRAKALGEAEVEARSAAAL